jgi:hypothetical protein
MLFETTTKGQYITILFWYKNAKIEAHNKCVFEKTDGETFTFHYEFKNVNRIICDKLCNIKWFHQWCRLNLSRLHKNSSKTINMDKIS